MITNKKASLDDIRRVKSFLVEYNSKYVTNKSGNFGIVIKADNEKIIGGISGKLCYGKLEIDILWISESERGCGIGKKLMEEAEKYAFEKDCNGITLYTWSFQSEGFYKKLGFVECGRISGYENDSEKIYLLKEIHGN